MGSFIEPHPPDFATIGDRDAKTTRPSIDVIENGIAQSAMPAFSGVLSISDIAAVAAYVQRAFGYAGATTRAARSGNADRRLTAASEDDSR